MMRLPSYFWTVPWCCTVIPQYLQILGSREPPLTPKSADTQVPYIKWWGIKNSVGILDLCISHLWIWATNCMLNFLIGLVRAQSYVMVITTRVRTCVHKVTDSFKLAPCLCFLALEFQSTFLTLSCLQLLSDGPWTWSLLKAGSVKQLGIKNYHMTKQSHYWAYTLKKS